MDMMDNRECELQQQREKRYPAQTARSLDALNHAKTYTRAAAMALDHLGPTMPVVRFPLAVSPCGTSAAQMSCRSQVGKRIPPKPAVNRVVMYNITNWVVQLRDVLGARCSGEARASSASAHASPCVQKRARVKKRRQGALAPGAEPILKRWRLTRPAANHSDRLAGWEVP